MHVQIIDCLKQFVEYSLCSQGYVMSWCNITNKHIFGSKCERHSPCWRPIMVILLWLLYNLRQIGTARQYFSRLLGTRLRQCYYNFTRDHGQQILAANHDVSFAYFFGTDARNTFLLSRIMVYPLPHEHNGHLSATVTIASSV